MHLGGAVGQGDRIRPRDDQERSHSRIEGGRDGTSGNRTTRNRRIELVPRAGETSAGTGREQDRNGHIADSVDWQLHNR